MTSAQLFWDQRKTGQSGGLYFAPRASGPITIFVKNGLIWRHSWQPLQSEQKWVLSVPRLPRHPTSFVLPVSRCGKTVALLRNVCSHGYWETGEFRRCWQVCVLWSSCCLWSVGPDLGHGLVAFLTAVTKYSAETASGRAWGSLRAKFTTVEGKEAGAWGNMSQGNPGLESEMGERWYSFSFSPGLQRMEWCHLYSWWALPHEST